MITQLALELHKEACSKSFNFKDTQKLMSDLKSVLTSDQGLTSFEFEDSGLLHSLQIYLTKSASQAEELIGNKYEESKLNEKTEINKNEAQSYLLRLKVFVDTMCTKSNNKLPFKQLFNLCLEQLTLAEPLIFNDIS